MKPSHVLRRNAMRLRAQIARMSDPLVVDVATAIAKAYDDLADLQDHRSRQPALAGVAGSLEMAELATRAKPRDRRRKI